jgi:poly-D-alanine transfer protein DltD
VSIEKGHDNPIGMCASVLDLALGFLEEENENEKTENSDTRMISDKSPVTVPTPLKAQTNKTSLFEILRNRIEDEKPLVRVKAIQIFGTALSLNYPKRVNNNNRDNEITVFQNEELDSQAEHFGNILFSILHCI